MYRTHYLKNYVRFIFVIILLFITFGDGKLYAQSPSASFTVAQSSGCIPFQVTFNNTSVNSTSWFWDFGNGNYSTSQSPTNIYLNQGFYTVKLIAYNTSGQADSIIQSGMIHTVSPPVVNFNSSSQIACLESSTISFTNQSSNYDSCVWDFGDGNTSYSISPVHNYNSPGIYTVTLIAYNSVFGCSSSLTKTGYITVLSNPAGSFTANETSFCLLQTPVLFQSQASSATNYTWYFGDGGSSTQSSPSHVYSQPGLYDVTLITSNQLGCTDTVTVSDYIEVLDNPVPVITSSNPLNGCAPYLSNFSTSVPNVILTTWTFGDGSTSQITAPNHSYFFSGIYPVDLQVTYANGCSNTSSVTVNAYPKPISDYSITNYQGCAPLTPVFVNQSTGMGYTYDWDFGDGTSSTLENPTHTYSTPGMYVTYLKVTDVNGCTMTGSFQYHIMVTSANAQFSADNLTGCNPHTVNFTHPGGGVYTYHWNFGDGDSSSLQSPSHTYDQLGNYSVTLTVTNGTGCVTTYVYPQQVQVSAGSNNFSPAPPVTSCAPFTVNLFDNSPATSGWLWDFGDGTTSTLQNPVHTYTTSGTFVVSLTTQSSGTACSQFISPYATYIINSGEPDFTVTQTLCPPFTATFDDNSVNAVAWLWNFGDGSTSTQQNPVHIYSNPGAYNISLTITTSQGCTFTMYHNYAVTFIPLFANGTAVTTDTILPLNVIFHANSSGATSWLWDFGDGTTSTDMNPVHIYTIPGPYDISLTISNPQCTYTYDYPAITFGAGSVLPGGGNDSIVVPPPVYSCVPYEMTFSNPVQNTVSWLWDFGDGVTSTLENPSHIYVDPGVYDVVLITWDAFGVTDTVTRPTPFYLMGASANFNINYSNNCQGSTVQMQNNSTPGVNYLWNFGDGSTSTLVNPTHTYSTTGVNYIISLSISDSLGCSDFMARSYYASVIQPLSSDVRRSCAGDTVHFNSGNINYSLFNWDFGDGTFSSDPNPLHVYADSGNFQVSLTVTDSLGCSSSWNLPYTIRIRKPVADFLPQFVVGICTMVRYEFANLSTGADSYVWDFGYGYLSSLDNPVKDFYVPGYNTMKLTANAEGCVSTKIDSTHIYFPYLTTNFSYSQSSDCYPITVTYSDSSINAVSWLWEFGDGTTSTLQNPVHTFTSKPLGPVSLTTDNGVGCSKSETKPNISAIEIKFSVSDTTGCSPFPLAIVDSSQNVASWLWDFGDGTTSTLQSPTHLFQTNGNFPVSLTATSNTGCTQTVSPVTTVKTYGPDAGFSMNSIVSCAPTIVNFFDNSSGATSWNWDFGNTNHSVLASPVHIYNQPGTYDVTLVVSDSAGCADTLLMPELVHITGSIADFSVTSTSGCSPWSVQFSDSSISAFSWLWNFGDGNISTQSNPNHVYDTPGSYMVTLITQDTTGCQSVFSNPVPLNVQQPPAASFNLSSSSGCVPFQVSINNTTVGGTSYLWDFGNGSNSMSVNPTPVYNAPGIYYITLIATNAQGCSDTIVSENPVVVGVIPQPAFTLANNSGCSPLTTQFANTSTNTDSTSVYLWNFGDGGTSNLQNPSHVFTQAGTFSVSLTITNNFSCSNTVVQNNIITVTDGSPPPPVMLKSVSVAGETAIDVTWANLPAQTLQAYQLYRYNPVSLVYDLIYTDTNPMNTSLNVTSVYSDTTVLTADKSYEYVVRAVNHCNVPTHINMLTPHHSIDLVAQVANNIAELNWNLYTGCSVGEYKIYREDDNQGIFNLIGSVDASINNFTDTTIYCGIFANYRVSAENLCGEGFTAWSDIEELQVPGILANQKVDMVRSTVLEDRYVFTEWAPPALAPQLLTGFELYRSTDRQNYTLLAVLPPTETSYSDFDTKVKQQNYYYKIKVTNVCGIEASQGFESSSVLLLGGIDGENRSLLRWTPYKNWDTGVDYYVIEKVDEFGVWQTIKVVNGNVLEYIDR